MIGSPPWRPHPLPDWPWPRSRSACRRDTPTEVPPIRGGHRHTISPSQTPWAQQDTMDATSQISGPISNPEVMFVTQGSPTLRHDRRPIVRGHREDLPTGGDERSIGAGSDSDGARQRDGPQTGDRRCRPGIVRSGVQLALQELRDVVRFLRDDEQTAVRMTPQRDLADLPALVEKTRSSGTPVDPLLPRRRHRRARPVARTAYRVTSRGLDERSQTRRRRPRPGST